MGFSVLVYLCTFFNPSHSFYLSVSQLEVSSNEIHIKHRIFLSDLEIALRKKYSEDGLSIHQLDTSLEEKILNYTAAHFSINSFSLLNA